MAELSKVKITVLKRTVNSDLAEEYLNISGDFVACQRFSDGQEIIIERYYEVPEDFCPWAWADIRNDVKTIAVGGNMNYMKPQGTDITGCTDWFRPVIFKIERIED